MKLNAAAVAAVSALLLVNTAEASLKGGSSASSVLPSGASIPADSVHGAQLLSKAMAKAKATGRNLEDNEEYTSWMVGYSLRFDSCHEIAAIGGEAGGGEGEGDGAGLQRLVKLRLCPKDTCSSSCKNGAEYVVELREFLEAYTKLKQEMEEAQCEQVQQTCEYQCQNQNNGQNQNQQNNNNNANNDRRLDDNNANGNNNNANNYYQNNEDYCQMNCLQEAGYGDCYEDDQNQQNGNNNAQEFEIERFAECEPLNENQNQNNGNGNGNYNGGQDMYYVGAFCSKGGSAINLGVFSDSSCTVKADNSLFEKYYYQSLPYATTSIVDRDCLSCDASDYEVEDQNGNNNNNNNNGNYEMEVAELCEQVHERSAKCEKNLKIESSSSYYQYYPHTESCDFIHSTLSSLESVTKSNGRSLRTARAFAWIFGLTTLGLGGYIAFLHMNKSKQNIDLSAMGTLS